MPKATDRAATDGVVLIASAFRYEVDFQNFKGDNRVRILLTGVGKQRARSRVRRALSEGGVKLVVSAGFSGGARVGLKAGDLIMASEVYDTESQRRWVPSALPSRLKARAAVGNFVTADRVVSDPREKEELGRKFNALGVDMETSAVAETADSFGVPWIALRVILDPVESRLKVTSVFQALKMFVLPARRREFFQFMGSVRRASGSLSDGIKFLVS